MRNSFLVKLGISVGAAVVLSTAVGAIAAQAAAAAPLCIDHAVTIRNNFTTFDIAAKGGKPDGFISREDMVAVAGGLYTRELSTAAQTFANNKFLFDRLDIAAQGGSTDNRISYADVQTFIDRGTCG